MNHFRPIECFGNENNNPTKIPTNGAANNKWQDLKVDERQLRDQKNISATNRISIFLQSLNVFFFLNSLIHEEEENTNSAKTTDTYTKVEMVWKWFCLSEKIQQYWSWKWIASGHDPPDMAPVDPAKPGRLPPPWIITCMMWLTCPDGFR